MLLLEDGNIMFTITKYVITFKDTGNILSSVHIIKPFVSFSFNYTHTQPLPAVEKWDFMQLWLQIIDSAQNCHQLIALAVKVLIYHLLRQMAQRLFPSEHPKAYLRPNHNIMRLTRSCHCGRNTQCSKAHQGLRSHQCVWKSLVRRRKKLKTWSML